MQGLQRWDRMTFIEHGKVRERLEYMVNRDKRIQDSEAKRQVVVATLRRLKDNSVTASTLSDIVSEEAEKMLKRMKR